MVDAEDLWKEVVDINNPDKGKLLELDEDQDSESDWDSTSGEEVEHEESWE